MTRYLIYRVGPSHAMGFGCVIGVILGLLPILMLVAGVLIVETGLGELLGSLGPLESALTPRLNIPWSTIGLVSLVVIAAPGVMFAIGGWLAALGFNLVAHVTGGLALDINPDTSALAIATTGATPYVGPVQKDPTMLLPRPLHGTIPPAPFPTASGSGAAFVETPSPQPTAPIIAPAAPSSPVAAPAQPGGVVTSVIQPMLISETDASVLWTLRKATTTIGSDPANDVVLTGDAHVAPKHAEIRAETSGYVLYNLGAPGGVYVNDRQVQGRNLLKDGFRIRLGGTSLVFRDLT